MITKSNLIAGLRTGWFLGTRQIKRVSKGTSLLTVAVMSLTFLNLTVVSGILVGLIEGSSKEYRQHYSGDFLVSSLPDRSYILRTRDIISVLEGHRATEALTARYLASGTVTANFQASRKPGENANSIATQIAGITPADEDTVTELSSLVVEGNYLDNTSVGEILVGSGLLSRYAGANVPGEEYLDDAAIGDKVRLTIGDKTYEAKIRGVVESKISSVNQRIFMNERELRQLLGRTDLNVGEIAVRLSPNADPHETKSALHSIGAENYALIQTWDESQGSFYEDIGVTFRVLGDAIGAIAVAVAAVTVFIVVFISAMNRRREIGILKGIGITADAIVFSYVIQALAYAAVGTLIGAVVLFAAIKPYFDANPIDFPFSDGILAVTSVGAIARGGVLLAVAALAGCLPTRMIVRRNTLDTILGR